MIDPELLLVLKSSVLGDGEPDLGERLLGAYLVSLLDSDTLPQRIVCMNSGVFLTTEGTPFLDVLRQFEVAGSKISSCGTCLNYYGRVDKLVVGREGTMKDAVAAMLAFPRILQP
jgi:selenium metabolism protein YedF